MKYKTTFVA